MDNFLLRTELVLEDCKEHLHDTDNMDSSIANYLTQYIAVIFCAEMEATVKELFDKSVKLRTIDLVDIELKEFIDNQLKRLKSSSLKKGDISNHIENFSNLAKEKFNSQLQGNDQAITSYSSVVTCRHSIAHTPSPSQVTFRELEKAVEAAKIILNAMQIALQQESHE